MTLARRSRPLLQSQIPKAEMYPRKNMKPIGMLAMLLAVLAGAGCGNSDKTEACLEQKIRWIATNAYLLRCGARLMNNNRPGAIEDFTKAIELNPKDARFYYYRGKFRIWPCNLDEPLDLLAVQGAIEDLTKAIELNPGYAAAFALRGAAKFAFEDYPGVMADITKAIELDPKNIAPYLAVRGSAKFQAGDKEGACQDLRKAAGLGDKTALGMIKEYCH